MSNKYSLYDTDSTMTGQVAQSQNLQILIMTLCSLSLFFLMIEMSCIHQFEMQQWQLLFLSGLYFLNLHEATGTFHLILWGRAVCRQGLYPTGR